MRYLHALFMNKMCEQKQLTTQEFQIWKPVVECLIHDKTKTNRLDKDFLSFISKYIDQELLKES